MSTLEDQDVAVRQGARLELLQEDLTPSAFRTSWAQALVACFEQAASASLAARQTAHLLAVATAGEKGLVALVKASIVQATKAADAKITAVSTRRMNEFEEYLTIATATAQREIAESSAEIRSAALAAAHQQKDLSNIIIELRQLQEMMKSELQIAASTRNEVLLSREHLKKLSFWKKCHILFSNKFNF